MIKKNMTLPARISATLLDGTESLFLTMWRLERDRREEAKERLKTAVDELDLFAPDPNHEDYVPGSEVDHS